MTIHKNKVMSIVAATLFVGCVSFMAGILVTEKVHAYKGEVEEGINIHNFNIEDKCEEFKNKQGTPISKCKENYCNKYISANGDTPYCEEHSNVCGICEEYISKEEKICVECKEELLQDILKVKFI